MANWNSEAAAVYGTVTGINTIVGLAEGRQAILEGKSSCDSGFLSALGKGSLLLSSLGGLTTNLSLASNGYTSYNKSTNNDVVNFNTGSTTTLQIGATQSLNLTSASSVIIGSNTATTLGVDSKTVVGFQNAILIGCKTEFTFPKKEETDAEKEEKALKSSRLIMDEVKKIVKESSKILEQNIEALQVKELTAKLERTIANVETLISKETITAGEVSKLIETAKTNAMSEVNNIMEQNIKAATQKIETEMSEITSGMNKINAEISNISGGTVTINNLLVILA